MRNLFKKTPLKTAIAFVGATLLSSGASAFDDIYFFGDSLSDTGNINLLYGGQAADRFTNGNTVAADVVAAHYGVPIGPSGHLIGQALGNNYAVGGARALDDDGDETTPDTNLPTQVNSYLTFHGGVADPEALYMVIMGGNDLFAAQGIRAGVVAAETGEERAAIRQAARESVKTAVKTLEAQVMKLVAAGAQNTCSFLNGSNTCSS